MNKKIETPALSENVKPGIEWLRKELSIAPVLAFLDRFDSFVQKKKKMLRKGETLFEPGENPYFYIVSSGALGIFRINPSGEVKELGKVYTGAFIGEGVLSERNTKDVLVNSITEKTMVVALTKEEIEYLESQDPAILAKLYKHINNITSLRLSETGKELALMYEYTQKIKEYQELWQRGLIAGVDHMKDMLALDAILMIEQHPFVPGLFIYKYNTKFPSVWPMNQKVDPKITITPGFSQVDFLTLWQWQQLYIEPMTMGEETVGYLVASKKNGQIMSDSEIRIMKHTTPLIATMLREVQHKQNEKEIMLKNQS